MYKTTENFLKFSQGVKKVLLFVAKIFVTE